MRNEVFVGTRYIASAADIPRINNNEESGVSSEK